ncbi:MAG: N-acetylmuramoyl-L-alanine amidase [Spirochaetia bacterium]|nr:N-acetylmuramoyl-L-alanine amidase [Spirochaetia bacterium]MCF7946473.1 N-acetylmuramoyl-L-alanine amidase [Spirochaetia bacterium]
MRRLGHFFTIGRSTVVSSTFKKAAFFLIVLSLFHFFSIHYLFSESSEERMTNGADTFQGIFRDVGTVIVDPGHGGKDPGAVFSFQDNGKTINVYEKDINLAVAIIVKENLENAAPDLTVFMTRTDDSFVSLWKRAETANKLEIANSKTKVLISIHANAAAGNSAKGFEVWMYNHSSDGSDGSEKKFAESTVSETVINNLITDLNNRLTEELVMETQHLADMMLSSLDDEIGEITYNRGLKEADFYILKEAIMPAVLVETGFITNYEEVKNLLSPKYQKRISLSICEGLKKYIQSWPNEPNGPKETDEFNDPIKQKEDSVQED